MVGADRRLLVKLGMPVRHDVRSVRHLNERPMPERREHDLAQLLDIVAPAVGLALVGRFLSQVLQMPRKGRGERRGVLLADDGRTTGESGRLLQRLNAGGWRAKGWPVSDGL